MAELRKTIARAFGRGLDPLEESGRGELQGDSPLGQRVYRAFEELHESLQRELDRDHASYLASGEIQLTPRKPGARGVEFRLLSPAGECEFIDGQNGYFWIRYRDLEGHRWQALYSFHPDDSGRMELVEKPVGSRRSPFRFTSLPAIIGQVLGGRGPVVPPSRES